MPDNTSDILKCIHKASAGLDKKKDMPFTLAATEGQTDTLGHPRG